MDDKAGSDALAVTGVQALALRIPTDQPESDGTFAWDATTLVIAEAHAGGCSGLGYTYSDASIVKLIEGSLAAQVVGSNAMDPPAAYARMQHQVRNIGREGLAATAISAVDAALWDLKARLLGLPLARLLGARRSEVEVYGSGGFTSYSDATLREQFSKWVERDGCRHVKMKVGRHPEQDLSRVASARAAAGSAELFVDANGAWQAKEALAFARRFADYDVRWFEEPVSSDDLNGLRLVREQGPAGMEVAAGEYGFTPQYFERMLAAAAVDVQQADMTRCGGVTGFMLAAASCDAHQRPLSAHCAPSLHLHVACAAPRLRHIEWFHDHVRIEHMLFDGAPQVREGRIRPDWSRPGNGLALRRADAERFRCS